MARHSRIGMYRRRQYWYFKYKTEDGRWVERATRTVNYQKARSIKAAFLDELESGRLPNCRSVWPLQHAASEWLRERQLRIARGSYLSERTITKNLVHELGAETKLTKLADVHTLRQYQSSRLRSGARPKTVNNELRVLLAIFRDANLSHRVSDYQPLRVQKCDVGTALTLEESIRLIQFASFASPMAVAPYVAVLAFATGMRSCEIKQLQLGCIHVNEPRPYLYVRRATTKSDKGARYVALDQMACWALRKLEDRARVIGATDAGHYLLPTLLDKHTRTGDPLSGGRGYDVNHPQASWDNEWGKLRNAVGISHRRFHDLRHTYITRAAEAGVPIAVAKAQVGHMSLQLLEHYTHICQAAIHQAAKRIEMNSQDLLCQLGLAEGTSADQDSNPVS